MSIKLMSQVWDLPLPDSQKLVLLALADCANDEGQAWPSVPTLCRKSTRSERTVQGVLIELETCGHIDREQIAGKGCRYVVHPRSHCPPQSLPPAADAPRSEPHPTPAAAAGKPSKNLRPQKASPSSVARKTHIPADFIPLMKVGGVTAKVVAGGPPGEIEEQVEHFIDHHTAKQTLSACWQASWRTWVKLGKRFNVQRPANDHRKSGDPARDINHAADKLRLGWGHLATGVGS